MGEFFESWHRKLGVVALLAACALTAGWVRSYVRCDTIEVPTWSNGLKFVTFIDSKNGVIQHINDHRNVLPWNFSFDTDETYEPYWTIAYSWIVLPLTVLSAGLLLSPRLMPRMRRREFEG